MNNMPQIGFIPELVLDGQPVRPVIDIINTSTGFNVTGGYGNTLTPEQRQELAAIGITDAALNLKLGQMLDTMLKPAGLSPTQYLPDLINNLALTGLSFNYTKITSTAGDAKGGAIQTTTSGYLRCGININGTPMTFQVPFGGHREYWLNVEGPLAIRCQLTIDDPYPSQQSKSAQQTPSTGDSARPYRAPA